MHPISGTIHPAARDNPPTDREPLPKATFRLGDKHCLVMPQALLDDMQQVHPGSQRCTGAPVGYEVIGECRIDEEQYLILSSNGEGFTPGVDLPPSITDRLTPREIQIAMQVAKGKYNKQIARDINVSEWTVSSHLRRIYAKLDVRTRAEMVAQLLKEVC